MRATLKISDARMNILGISAYYHDSAACLVRDGRIVAAAQEERFTRRKHDHNFPARAVEFCLGRAGLGGGQVDLIAFYDKPLLKFERLLETYIDHAPAGLRSFLMAMPIWLREKIWIREQVAKHANYQGKVLFTEHHESHAEHVQSLRQTRRARLAQPQAENFLVPLKHE
ncbi:MAG TPA: carbamoyltransferase N-terminal domain-containing protein [Pyrinomonadaceae bacterium]|nr:carbamoyltransferase N-terminal domain-containing protein [Pyrinomonadaceae bacterium]